MTLEQLPSMDERPLICVRALTKSFGVVRALTDVDIDFERGKVHGLVGANGAGKSTLLNILGGAVRRDAGSIELDGRPVEVREPRQAADLGFAFIWQELALVPEFSGVENMTLPTRPRTFMGLRDRKWRRVAARAVADRLRLTFDLDRPVRTLTVADREMVAIGRALVLRARFVAMDEPTSSLSDVESSRLFRVIRELAASGVAVAYVTHRLYEIEDLCDRVTVFREGKVAARFSKGSYTRREIVLALTGVDASAKPGESSHAELEGERVPVLEVRHISRPPRVKDVSFTLHRGEILGLAGVVGAGRTEVARMIFGADRVMAGNMVLLGQPFHPKSIAEAIGRGVALVPEERRSQALVIDDSVTANINMGNWSALRLLKYLPFTSDRLARRRTQAMAALLSIKMTGAAASVRTLSGGNQQKVIFGRWMARESKVLLLDEPTRGVDVGARRQIWDSVETFASQGNCVLAVCSELAELSTCHRVVIIVEGRDVGEIEGPGVTEERMNEAIYSIYSEGEHRRHGARADS
jgi:ABC-type sugar transport system ATPase subunit